MPKIPAFFVENNRTWQNEAALAEGQERKCQRRN
jgi:hypothetical protein